MNLSDEIPKYLPKQVMDLLKTTSEQAGKLGVKVYLVGGVVRDLLLGYPNFDLDLLVEGDAAMLAHAIAEIGQAKLVVHPAFGTAKLSYGDFTLDMATARSESYAKPGALPAVAPGSLNNDLSRRDFSINAMAISLAPDNYGELIDPYHGRTDLEQHDIRILHSKSFSDDATRILRAIRYEQRLGFRLETQTAKLLKRNILKLDTISADRLRHELELILREKYPEHAIKRLGELGVLQRLGLPLTGDGWIAGKFEKARCLNKPDQLPLLYFCLLVYPLSEAQNEQFIRRVNIPKNQSRVLHDTLSLKAALSPLDRRDIKASEVYYLLCGYDPLAIQANIVASGSATIQNHMQLFLSKLRHVKTLLDGEELRRLGISTGPEIGKALQILHKARLDGEIKNREDERRLALSIRTIQEEG
jgi:tRNA nucleotidyltransferase (CCA-adding enzyme)